MLANFSEVELYMTVSKFGKKKSKVFVLCSRRSRTMAARQCGKMCHGLGLLLFCKSKPIAFLMSSLSSTSSLLMLFNTQAMKICQIHPWGELHDITRIESTLHAQMMNGLEGSAYGNTLQSKRTPLKNKNIVYGREDVLILYQWGQMCKPYVFST